MGPVAQQGFIPGSVNVQLSAAQNIKITNLPLTLANTEYSIVLTDALKQLIIKCRSLARLQIAFISTESGTKFLTIPGGVSLSLQDLNLSSTTLYIQADAPASIVEIVEMY